MRKTVYLLRHAEPVRQDQIKRYLGQSDPVLSSRGERQAEQIAAVLGKKDIEAVYSSDLLRAEKTARIIASKLASPVIIMKELREINLGEWEGKSFDEVAAQNRNEFILRGKDIENHCPPGGESFADLAERAVPAFEKAVENSNGNIVIVAHAGVNRVILCHILQLPLRSLFALKQDYARANIIEKNSQGYRVQGINEILSD